MSVKIKPRGKYIIVRPDSEDVRESKHGILTPTNVEQERKTTGEVLGVGKDIKDIDIGDRVIFGTYAGDQVKMDGVEYKILHDDDVLALL